MWLKIVVAALFLGFCSLAVEQDEFEYFDKGVDYWNEADAKKPPVKKAKKKATVKSKQGGFPWNKYMTPDNKEFFREGNHLPPEPFMEVFGNPTDENMEKWHAYIAAKNKFLDRFVNRLNEYRAKKGLNQPLDVKASKPTKQQVADTKRFRFRLYFSSECPHCVKMFQTMRALRDNGFYVELVQVDEKEPKGIPFATRRASQEELTKKSIQSVPLLLIGDLKKKVVFRLTGYRTLSDVISALGRFG